MKKITILFSILFATMLLYSQEVLDIGGKQRTTIGALNNNEEFIFKKIGTTQGFELDLFAKSNDGNERCLGKISHYSNYGKLCNNLFYFSISNYYGRKENPDLFDELFVLDIKKGVIEKLLDSFAFTVSDDGKYICYHEVPQKKKMENHEVSYWYIYNTKTKKNNIIIDKQQKNNWQVNVPSYDQETKSFVFTIGYDDVVVDSISFNPYEMNF